MKNIIAIDFDDCIYPSATICSDFRDHDLALRQLEINLLKLTKFCQIENASLFIISSWFMEFDFWPELKSISLKDTSRHTFKIRQDTETSLASRQFTSHLAGLICGVSEGNRIRDIKKLDDGTNKIVAFDDMDLYECQSDNMMYLPTFGSLDNRLLWRAQCFFRNLSDPWRKKYK